MDILPCLGIKPGCVQSRTLALDQSVCEWLVLTGSVWDLFDDRVSSMCPDM